MDRLSTKSKIVRGSSIHVNKQAARRFRRASPKHSPSQTGISKILAISINARDQYFGEGSNNTKGAGKLGGLPNHKGCQYSTRESKAGQPHRTCHRKGVLDIEYLTIHVDAGAMALYEFVCMDSYVSTCRRDLPPRLAAETFRRDEAKHNTT